MLALGHDEGRRPQNHPDVEDDGRLIGPGQGLVEAKSSRDLDHENHEQRQKKGAADGVGGPLEPAYQAHLTALMRSTRPLGQTLA